MAQHRCTEKPSRVLKNFSPSKGLDLEILHSEKFHLGAIPVLISAALLRTRNMGQVDLARLKKDNGGWIIELAEVKSSQVGLFQAQRSQNMRLSGAGNFLAALLGARLRMINLVG